MVLSRNLKRCAVCLIVGLNLAFPLAVIADTISCAEGCASASATGSGPCCCGCGESSSQCKCCAGETCSSEGKSCTKDGTAGTASCSV